MKSGIPESHTLEMLNVSDAKFKIAQGAMPVLRLFHITCVTGSAELAVEAFDSKALALFSIISAIRAARAI